MNRWEQTACESLAVICFIAVFFSGSAYQVGLLPQMSQSASFSHHILTHKWYTFTDPIYR